MKRIVSFLILLATFIAILTLPTAEAAPAPAVQQPLPVWSILLYVAVVFAAGMLSMLVMKREKEKPAVAQAG